MHEQSSQDSASSDRPSAFQCAVQVALQAIADALRAKASAPVLATEARSGARQRDDTQLGATPDAKRVRASG
eukprot:12992957-Alexandrium_andersonii.AAC.2